MSGRTRLIQCGIFGALTAAHIAMRDFSWRFDWARTVFQYGFVVVLTAPVAAAFASLAARELRPRASLIISSGAYWRAIGRSIWESFAPGLAVHLMGMIAVVGIAWGSTGNAPPPYAFAPAANPIALLFVAAMLGWVSGWVSPRWWVPVAASASVFVVTMWLYFVAEVLIRVGGATSPLVGRQINGGYLAWQLAWFVSLAVGLVLVITDPTKPLRLNLARLGGFLLPALVGALAVAVGPDLLSPRPVGLNCDEAVPQICVYSGYEAFREDASQMWQMVGADASTLGIEVHKLSQLQDNQTEFGVVSLPIADLPTTRGIKLEEAVIPPACNEAMFRIRGPIVDTVSEIAQWIRYQKLLRDGFNGAGYSEWLTKPPDQVLARVRKSVNDTVAWCRENM